MQPALPISILAVLAIGPATAAAEPSADAVLLRAYENYRGASSVAKVAMTVHRPGWERHMEMQAWTRGDDDALVRFTAPPKDAGNATLKLGGDTWLFNPKLNQVIKLPASMLSQSWMGSDFSYSDLAKSEEIINEYTHRLTATSKTQDRTVWTIESTPKAEAPVVWGKVIVQVRDDYVMTGETFYDQDMKPVRQMVVESIEALGGRVFPAIMTMHPLDQPGQWTRIQTSAAQFNVNVPAHLFTLSNLQNPRM